MCSIVDGVFVTLRLCIEGTLVVFDYRRSFRCVRLLTEHLLRLIIEGTLVVFDYRRGFRRLVLSQPKSGNDKSPLRGLYGISVCSPWGKKSQSAAVIPSGAPSAWMALLSEFFADGQ